MGCRIENTMKATAPPMIDEHQRLEQRGEARELGVDLGFVGRRDALEHLLELAGLLADRDHVDHRRRELAGLLAASCASDSPSVTAFLASSIALLDEDVADDLLGGVERAQHRHTRLQHRAERAGEPTDVDRANELAERPAA